MLPSSLLCLISLILSTNAQSRTQLSLNTVFLSNSQSSFSIPGQDELTITIALCSSSSPRFFLSNSTNNALEDDPGPDGGEDVYEILLQNGFGNWTGAFPSGGVLQVEGLPPGASFEVGVSNDGMSKTLLGFFSPLLIISQAHSTKFCLPTRCLETPQVTKPSSSHIPLPPLPISTNLNIPTTLYP